MTISVINLNQDDYAYVDLENFNIEAYPEREGFLYRADMCAIYTILGLRAHVNISKYEIRGETPYYWKLWIDGKERLRLKNATKQFAHRNIRDALHSCLCRAKKYEKHSQRRYEEAVVRRKGLEKLFERSKERERHYDSRN